MQYSELYFEYRSQFITNCEKLQVISLNDDYDEFKKCIKENILLYRHIQIEICSLGNQKANQEHKVLKKFKDKFIQCKRLYEQNQKLQFNKKSNQSCEENIQNNEKLIEYQSNQINNQLYNQRTKLQIMRDKMSKISIILQKVDKLSDILLFRSKKQSMIVYGLIIFISVIVIFQLFNINDLFIKMLLDEIRQQCRQHRQKITNIKLSIIIETYEQHGDFILIGWLLDELIKGKNVEFITFRQNYAHYLNISKKMGHSIQIYLKKGQLKYYECFKHPYCSMIPLTQTSPQCYCIPPQNIIQLEPIDVLIENKIQFRPNSSIFVDSLNFNEHIPQIIITLYQRACALQCTMMIGGAQSNSQVFKILQNQAELLIQLENDVSSHGKFTLIRPHYSKPWSLSLLWLWRQGKFQISQYIKL